MQCKIAGYPLHSHISPSLPLPCASVCHQIPNALYDERPGYADPTLLILTRTKRSIYCTVYVFFSKVLHINVLNIWTHVAYFLQKILAMALYSELDLSVRECLWMADLVRNFRNVKKKINNFLGVVSQRWTLLCWKFCRNQDRLDEPTLGYCILGLYIMDVIIWTQRPLGQHLVSLLRLFVVVVKGNSWALFPFPAKYLAAIVLLMETLHIA